MLFTIKPLFAEWETIYFSDGSLLRTNDGGVLAYDNTDVNKILKSHQITMRQISPSSDYREEKIKIDCYHNKYKILSSFIYITQMKYKSPTKSTDWKPIIKDAVYDVAKDIVCNKKLK